MACYYCDTEKTCERCLKPVATLDVSGGTEFIQMPPPSPEWLRMVAHVEAIQADVLGVGGRSHVRSALPGGVEEGKVPETPSALAITEWADIVGSRRSR